MKITDPGARVGIVVSFVLLVPSAYVFSALLLELIVATETGPAINIEPICNAVLFLGTIGAVAFCVRNFRGEAEDVVRPRWRMTEGVVGGIVAATSFILLALLWSLAYAGESPSIRLSGIVVFGVIGVGFVLSTIRLRRMAVPELTPR